MKTIPFYLLLLTFALLAACYPAQEPEQPTATAAVVSQVADTATPIAPTSTTLPATATATATPLPTATETATPLPAATLPPFTQGRIVFWWYPVLIPSEPDQSYPKEPSSGLYQAIPGSISEDWIIQPLLEDIGLSSQTFLSPDQTKLAILIKNDSTRSTDINRIHIYTFADGSLLPLNNQDPLLELSWLPDSQAVIYSQSSNIELARLDGSPPERLTNYPPSPIEGEPYYYIRELGGAPDGSLLALDIESGTGLSEGRLMPNLRILSLFDTQQKAITSDTENSTIGAIEMRWSPDSKWLAFTGGQNQGLSVLNVKTLAVQQLVKPPFLAFPVWSRDKSQLAFASDGKISIWHAESQTIQKLTTKDYVSEPAWSPDGSLIAAIYQEAGESGIVIVNPSTQSEEILKNSVSGGQVVWSPDGQWLTGLFSGQKGFGLYVVDKNTGEAHFVLDTAGFPSPSSIMWLP